MQPAPSAVFLIHLVQDVNVLRPLVFMAARDFHFDTLLLVSGKFGARDVLGIWRKELEQICAESGARLGYFDTDWEAHRHLTGHGLLFTASESHLHNHVTTHDVLRHAPPRYLRVTLQHGFECVGFRHSAEHLRAHGKTASFGADIVCSWSDGATLKSLAASQRSKLLVAGPTSVLQLPSGRVERKPGAPGMVCENLHSVRFSAEPHVKSEFVATFAEFARLMALQDRRVTLRPHAGGQYFFKNKLALPANVDVENAPMYRLDLRRFSYGISAPSSVLIDMLLAGMPTAVWRDRHGNMDAGNYDGLETISSAEEWVRFAKAAEADPEPFLGAQERFLEKQEMPLDPRTVFDRFAELFQAAARMEVRPAGSVAEHERILFVANGKIPTLQLSFEKPLAPLVARGEIATRLLTEPELRQQLGASEDEDRAAEWVERYLDRYNPSVIVFCRYSGPAYQPVLDWARRQGVPVIYQIDDDLLGIPRDIGERKFAFHNAPERIAAVTALLNAADLVYTSTDKLKARLLGYFPKLPMVVGKIYCSSMVLRRPSRSATPRVGYMASADHAHNLEMVLPAIEKLLDRNEHVQFALFGSIAVPETLKRFGDRVITAPAIGDYATFLDAFVKQEWDVGICPLAPIEFNMMKTNAKWVEYTTAGAAVVASRGTVYDKSCSGGCGILADTADEWFSALDLLVNNVDERVAMVERAQAKLEQEYSIRGLREQVLKVIAQAHSAIAADRDRSQEQRKERVCQLP